MQNETRREQPIRADEEGGTARGASIAQEELIQESKCFLANLMLRRVAAGSDNRNKREPHKRHQETEGERGEWLDLSGGQTMVRQREKRDTRSSRGPKDDHGPACFESPSQ